MTAFEYIVVDRSYDVVAFVFIYILINVNLVGLHCFLLAKFQF